MLADAHADSGIFIRGLTEAPSKPLITHNSIWYELRNLSSFLRWLDWSVEHYSYILHGLLQGWQGSSTQAFASRRTHISMRPRVLASKPYLWRARTHTHTNPRAHIYSVPAPARTCDTPWQQLSCAHADSETQINTYLPSRECMYIRFEQSMYRWHFGICVYTSWIGWRELSFIIFVRPRVVMRSLRYRGSTVSLHWKLQKTEKNSSFGLLNFEKSIMKEVVLHESKCMCSIFAPQTIQPKSHSDWSTKQITAM